MPKPIEELLADVTAALDKVGSDYSKQADAALKEAKNAGALSAATKDSVDKIALQFNSMTQAQAALQTQLGEVEQAVAAIPSASRRSEHVSAGYEVVNHEQVKAFAAAPEAGRRVSIPLNAALLSSDLPPNFIEPERLPGIDQKPRQRLFIRDLIAPGRTVSPAIFYVQQTGFVNAARVVAEGTKKPYSSISFASKIQAVATIAHLFKASKQILDDLPQLQSLIDADGRYGLSFAEEQEFLFGSGTGASLHGIVPQATAFEALFDVEKQSGIDDLRLAMLQAQLARVPATGHVLHFIDWAKIELQKDTLGRYILGNPIGQTGPALWGLPVVPTEIPAFLGKFLTGAFRDGAQYFDREDANVVISTENADDFENNLITVRAEKRTGMIVKRPEGFIFGAFTPPTVGGGG